MKHLAHFVLAAAALVVAGCNTAEKPVRLADLHPSSPSRATYNPTNDCTTIEMDGGTMRMKGNTTNWTFYPAQSPQPIPPKRFEELYQFANPQTAVAVDYLGQKEGYAYLRVRSLPVDHPKKISTRIVYVPLTDLDPAFRATLPAKGSPP